MSTTTSTDKTELRTKFDTLIADNLTAVKLQCATRKQSLAHYTEILGRKYQKETAILSHSKLAVDIIAVTPDNVAKTVVSDELIAQGAALLPEFLKGYGKRTQPTIDSKGHTINPKLTLARDMADGYQEAVMYFMQNSGRLVPSPTSQIEREEVGRKRLNNKAFKMRQRAANKSYGLTVHGKIPLGGKTLHIVNSYGADGTPYIENMSGTGQQGVRSNGRPVKH